MSKVKKQKLIQHAVKQKHRYMNAESRPLHILNNEYMQTLCMKQQDDWLRKGVKSRRKTIKYVCLSHSFHGNLGEGYACCLFPTPLLPVLASNVCSHGDRLFHLVNMMWHVSSCTSQEMTGDWFILLPTQAMNDDTVKKLRSQHPKGQFSNCHVLYLKLKKFSLWNSVATLLSGMIMWSLSAIKGQTVTLWLF